MTPTHGARPCASPHQSRATPVLRGARRPHARAWDRTESSVGTTGAARAGSVGSSAVAAATQTTEREATRRPGAGR